jgi:molecular chaperone GrpE
MTNETNDAQFPGGASQGKEGTGKDRPLSLEEQVSALGRDLEAARREVSQNLDLAQRAQAELANYRRRADEERASFQKYSNSRLITRLLVVIDELDLAIVQAGEHSTNSPWLEGIKLIQRKLSNLLDSEGVAKIDAVGVVFNPLEHEALEIQETNTHPPGYITKVVRSGYRLHDRVIQPAKVVVAGGPQTTARADHSSQLKETEYD